MEKKRIITFGEVLLRLSTQAFTRFSQSSAYDVCFGGSEANVAISLSLLGNTTAHVSCIPTHDLGESVIETLKSRNVITDFITKCDGRLGIYFLENGAMHRPSKIIYDRFDSCFSKLKKESIDWRNIFTSADWFHWSGITPAISSSVAEALLEGLQIAKEMGITVSADINYRRNLWQYGKSAIDVMPKLISLSDVVVADVTDVQNCTGIAGDSFEDSADQLMKQFRNIKKVTTTKRVTVSSSHNQIMALLWNGDTLHKSKTYDLTHIVDRIGSGDAFIAGLIHASRHSNNEKYILEFATAACALKHSIQGDSNLATEEEIQTLLQGKNTGQLLR